ncbi:MAG: DUF6680 family protein [Candidatus Binataceae bacterium]
MSQTVIIDVATIAAIILGPIIALQLQTHLDKRRAAEARKLSVFKTLMTYRATTLSPNFVQALNLIDVEFSADGEKPVRDAWKILLDHFYDLGEFNRTGAIIPQTSIEKSATLTASLLLAMGKSLGYEFDEVQIKKGAYYPMGLGNVEQEQHALRRLLLDVLLGKRRVPVAVFEDKFPPITLQPDIEAEKLLEETPPMKKLSG